MLVGVCVMVVSGAHVFWPLSCFFGFVFCLVNNGWGAWWWGFVARKWLVVGLVLRLGCFCLCLLAWRESGMVGGVGLCG